MNSKSKLLLSALLILISSVPMSAIFNPHESDSSYFKPRPKDPIPVRPFSESTADTQDINGVYANGTLILSFTEPEGMAVIKVYDMMQPTAVVSSAYINTATTATIAVPTAPGFYRIAITTSLNNQYEGFYTVF